MNPPFNIEVDFNSMSPRAIATMLANGGGTGPQGPAGPQGPQDKSVLGN